MKKKPSGLLLPSLPLFTGAIYFLFLCVSVKTAGAEVWGDVNLGIYPLKSHIVAPNGLVYKPLSRIGINLNIGSNDIYIFNKSAFLLEKPTPGVTTNSNQGSLDFTKREFDFKIGLAAKPLNNKNFELRLWAISLNNLNRGKDQNKPSGFKDGIAGETRYYYNGGKIWGYIAGGYYFTKELVEPNGEAYKPGVFVGSKLNYDILTVPKKLYAFMNLTVINLNGRFEGGLAYRPLKKLPDTEMRISGSRYISIKERSPGQSALLFEIRHYFTAK